MTQAQFNESYLPMIVAALTFGSLVAAGCSAWFARRAREAADAAVGQFEFLREEALRRRLARYVERRRFVAETNAHMNTIRSEYDTAKLSLQTLVNFGSRVRSHDVMSPEFSRGTEAGIKEFFTLGDVLAQLYYENIDALGKQQLFPHGTAAITAAVNAFDQSRDRAAEAIAREMTALTDEIERFNPTAHHATAS